MKTHLYISAFSVWLATCLGLLAQDAPAGGGDQNQARIGDTNALTAAIAELQTRIAQPDARTMKTFLNEPDAAARLVAAERSRQAVLAAQQNAREEIEVLTDGAIARFGPHQVSFPSAMPGVITLRTPDGLSLQSRVLGLCYFSDTGKSVLLAQLKESAGELVGSTTVIYRDAFDGENGVAADLVYEYTRTSFEQTVVIRKGLPEPGELGFTADDNVRLAVLTEFLNPPQPRRDARSISLREAYQALGLQHDESMSDETLIWGAMRMTAGRSFTLGEPRRSVPSGKSWEVLLGPQGEPRQFLIEATPYRLIKPQLDALPAKGAMLRSPGRPQQLKSALVQLKTPAARTSASRLMAKAGTAVDAAPGVVLDYLMVNTALLNVQFVNTGKYGPAAFGSGPYDYWNPYDCNGCLAGSLADLYWSDWSPSTVGIIVSNAPGVGCNPLCGWPVDYMYACFIYPANGGHITVTITNLPSDEYDLVAYATRASEAGAPMIELKRDGATLWYKGTTLWGNGWYSTYWDEHEQFVRFRNIAVNNQTLTLDVYPDASGYASLSGLQIVPSGAVPAYQPGISNLLNVNFGGSSGDKVGPAVVGLSTNDYWNPYSYVWAYATSVPNLKWSDQSTSAAGMVVRNAPGQWGNSLPDMMFRSYIYCQNGGNITLTLTNLPSGTCDLYLYGHTPTLDDNAVFELWSDNVNWGIKGTSLRGYGPTSNNWEVGQQYVLFKNVAVCSNQPVIIQAKHNTYGYNNLSGLQIAYTGPYDSDGDSLPDGWEWKWFGTLDYSAGDDPDGDNLNNLREYQLGLDPTRDNSSANGIVDWLDSEFPWLEDAVPQSGYPAAENETWNWATSWYDGDGWGGAAIYPHSGSKTHVSAKVNNAMHQHYFERALSVIRPRTGLAIGEKLYAWVNLDSTYPPAEVMLQWYVVAENGYGSWEHRAYWGADLIAWGQSGTQSRFPMGALPAAGQWVRLEVPASDVGLEGKVIEGMAFALHGGRAAWDSAGIFNPDMDGDGWLDTEEIYWFGNLRQNPWDDYSGDGLPNILAADPLHYDTSLPSFTITSPSEGAEF